MTGSPFTPEQEARLRAIMVDAAMPAYLLALAAIVVATIVAFILVAQWIFA